MKKGKLLVLLLTAIITIFTMVISEKPTKAAGEVELYWSDGSTAILGVYPDLQAAIDVLSNGASAKIRLLDNVNIISPNIISVKNQKNIYLETRGFNFWVDFIYVENAALDVVGNVYTTNTMAIAGTRVTNQGYFRVTGNYTSENTGNGTYGLLAELNSKIIINGNVITQGQSITASDNSEVLVSGNVESKRNATGSKGMSCWSGGFIAVSGNVKTTEELGIYIKDNTNMATVIVGSVNATRTGASVEGGRLIVNGNLLAGNNGLEMRLESIVYIEGILTKGVAGSYIRPDYANMTPFPETLHIEGKKVYYDYSGDNGWGQFYHVYILKENLAKPVVTDPFTQITFKYPRETGANYYEIQRSTKATKGFATIGTTTDDFYPDIYLTAGKTYYYRVRSVRIVGTKKVYGKWSAAVKLATAALPKPGGNVLVDPVNRGIGIDFDNVLDVKGLQIYYATTNTSKTKWKVLQCGSGIFEINNLEPNKKYFVKYRYIHENGSISYGPFSNVVTVTTLDTGPKMTVYSSSVAVTVDYPKIDGAEFYQIYRSTKKTKGFALAGTSNTLSFNDYYLKANTTYYYKVRAAKTVNGKLVYTAYLPTLTYKTSAVPGINLTDKAFPGAINFSFFSVLPKECSIQIYYATTNTRTTKWKVATFSGTDFTLNNLKSNQKYFYKAQIKYGLGTVNYGPFSPVKSIVTK